MTTKRKTAAKKAASKKAPSRVARTTKLTKAGTPRKKAAHLPSDLTDEERAEILGPYKDPFPLAERHRAVVDHYLASPEKSWRASYIAVSNGTLKGTQEQQNRVAHQKVWLLRQRPDVQRYLRERQHQLAQEAGIEVQKLLGHYLGIALADVRQAFDENGDLLKPSEWPDSVAMAVIGFDAAGRPKFAPKTSALDSIAKIIGAFEKDNAQNNPAALFASLLASVQPTTTPPGAR